MNSSAPIPPPPTGECFRCGRELQQLTEFCPACGTRLNRQRRRWAMPQVAVLIFAILSTLMSRYAGTCALVFASGEGIREIGMPATVGYYFLVPALLVFALCVWWLRSILRSKSP